MVAKNLVVKSGKKSRHKCQDCGWTSDPEMKAESQDHGFEVHKARMHKPKTLHALAKKEGVSTRTISRRKKRSGILAVVGDVAIRERNRPPKDFFELKRGMIQNAANARSEEASDAFLESAAALHSVLKKYTK